MRVFAFPGMLLLLLALSCSRPSESPSTTAEASASTETPYELAVNAPTKAAVGQEARAEIVVTPSNGFKINLDYPAKLILGELPAGTKVEFQTVTKAQMSVEKTRLLAPVAFTAENAGTLNFEGELRFSVCNENTCQMPRENISWSTTAQVSP